MFVVSAASCVTDLAEMIDVTLPKLSKRGPYKKEEISN
jgi:hypothetical protein